MLEDLPPFVVMFVGLVSGVALTFAAHCACVSQCVQDVDLAVDSSLNK